jgi:hypothetical protein
MVLSGFISNFARHALLSLGQRQSELAAIKFFIDIEMVDGTSYRVIALKKYLVILILTTSLYQLSVLSSWPKQDSQAQVPYAEAFQGNDNRMVLGQSGRKCDGDRHFP